MFTEVDEMKRCGIRYGAKRNLICKRLAGHKGPHGLRLWLDELARTMVKP